MKLSSLFNLALLVIFILTWVLTGNYLFGFVANILLSIGLFLKGRFHPFSPYSWFPPFVTLYNLSIFILDYLGYRTISTHNELLLVNILSLLGLFVSFSFLAENKVKGLISKNTTSDLPLNLILNFLFLACSFVCVSFLLSGAQLKSEFSGSFNSFFKLLNFFFCVKITIYAFRNKGRFSKKIIFTFLPLIVFSSLLLGERDILFSFLIILLMVYSFFNKDKIPTVYIIASFLLFLIPILGEYKNLFTKTEFKEIEYSNIFILILNGEFRSAGYNMDYILNHYDEPFRYGYSIFEDFMRSVVPGFIFEFSNSVGWYNRTYHPEIVAMGRGYGFSLSAEGFINFGYLGVFIWYMLIGTLISFLHNLAFKSTLFFSVYIVAIPMFIYSIRGDMSTLLSPLIKAIFIPLIFIVICERFFVRLKSK
ncbi:oligosaccharide repeat unit polymerase [Vibrio kanaloae]|uniref:O-antigen polymerase n=1 Tax=Vibrio kanaloae TaxID=170673 RepID=UPI001F3A8309|nr:O-antigen polymerase [Vibrio kanaloae]UIJ40620.1 oligosaccharide repeat unit polymerase [Vibrio kanaloae]